ncbi:MAG: hypothetical protein ACRDX8_13890 [Acidimicrobiales bacterium]
MAAVETSKVSPSGQMSLPAAARHRWSLEGGGHVEVIDLGFAILTVPAGQAARLIDEVLPAQAHHELLAIETDPDLIS